MAFWAMFFQVWAAIILPTFQVQVGSKSKDSNLKEFRPKVTAILGLQVMQSLRVRSKDWRVGVWGLGNGLRV